MIAAKVLDVISGAQDKQVMQYRVTFKCKWKTRQSFWDYKQGAQPSGFVHHDPDEIQDPAVPLERILYGHPLAGLLLGATI